MRPVLILLPFLLLAGCATPPARINNVCTVFEQRDGLFNNWYRAAKSAERKYGIPASVLMATVRIESGFDGNARPPRSKLFGFIPWKRPSSAYGYSQALNGTWDGYKSQTGNWGARRTSFADAIDFVGWYHNVSNKKNGIARNDAYNLYLAYYSGHAGYERGSWRGNSTALNGARKAQNMAEKYASQMRQCGL